MEKYQARVEEIAPGVRLCAVKTDGFKTSCLSFTMALPLEGDIEARAILPFMLHRFCRKYPGFSQLSGRLAELYGAALSAGVSKVGEAQLLDIEITAIDDRFALDDENLALSCTELLLDMIFDPNVEDGAFLEEDMKREKRLMVERIESEKNDKRVYALRRCEAFMCKDEKYSLNPLGEKADVEALNGKQVYKAWQEVLKTAKIQISLAGSADSQPVLSALKERFAGIERDTVDIKTEFIERAAKPGHYSEDMAVEQGKLVMGFRAGMKDEDDNNVALKVMNFVFGGSPHSKLFVNVREKMSLSYYCSSSFVRAKGLIFVQSGIDTDKEEAASKAILGQLDEIKEGGVSEEELKAAKLNMADALRGVEDSPDLIVAWYKSQVLKDEFTTPAKELEKMQAIGLEEVIKAAQKVELDTIFMLRGTGGEEAEDYED